MRVVKVIFFSFIIFSSTKILAQSKYEKLIIGKWVGAKKETKAGRDTLNNGKKMKELGKYEFQRNGVLIDYSNSVYPNILTYSINGFLLQFGKLYFKIEKLTKKELVIIDYDLTDPNSQLVFRHYFLKSTSHK